MGAVASKSEKIRLKNDKSSIRQYKLPHVRLKERYDAAESTKFSSSYEASVDKFDYLIIFPLTEGPYVHPTKGKSGSEADLNRISWAAIKDLWRAAVPGKESKKDAAENELKKIWKLRTNNEPDNIDTMRMNAWLTIARETIVEQLSSKCGLQLKLTANSSHIFCRIRAPIKLLELQADADNYRLQLKGEIDPGSAEFWNLEIKGKAVEIEEEKVLYDLDEAKIILEKLYRAGKISANDITINTMVESQSTYSRRIHALERIADKVPVFNKYVAYNDYQSSKQHLRYLYQTYPSVRGHTLFRSKDRLLLTKSIIDNYIDFSLLELHGVVTGFMALHDANRGEKLTVDSLSRNWTTCWNATAAEVGSPLVTHDAYEEGVEGWWFLRPFSQPLSDVREYFGEKVAMYFAWLGFFTYYLTGPTLIGLGAELLYYLRGFVFTVGHPDWPMYGIWLMLVTGAVVFDQSWKIECKAIALKWGTRGFESEEKDRPRFRGDEYKPVERSVINNRNVTNFPSGRRYCLTFGSYILILLLIGMDLTLFYGILYGHTILMAINSNKYGTDNMYFAMSVLVAIGIQMMSFLFKKIAVALNENENYRNDTDYEDSLVIKILTFELFNSFAACVFTAFFKDTVFSSCKVSCVHDLRVLLFAIIVVRLVRRGIDVMVTTLRGYFRRLVEFAEKSRPSKEETQALMMESADEIEFMSELHREPYEGTFDDFANAYMQFSYINLFCVVMPLLPLIALLENLVKIRLDAYQLCRLSRRPHVEQCEDAGYWSQNMTLMIYLGVFMNIALLIFAESGLHDYSLYVKTILFLSSSMVVMGYIYFLQYMLPEEPEFITEIAERQQFMIDKYVKGFDDDDEDLDMNSLKGNLDDTIDVDGLNLYDLRKDPNAFTHEEVLNMDQLEKKRRELKKELVASKAALQEVYKTELFNENSGVGETKHGLPLGRVTLQLIEIQGLLMEELDLRPKDLEIYGNNHAKLPVKIRISFMGTKAGAPAPAPSFGATAETDRKRNLVIERNGTVTVNQALGPFAPIRTVDADVLFEVLYLADNEDPLKIATASVSLKALIDQMKHDKILPLKIKQKSGEKESAARLYVSMQFEYSKVVTFRSKVYQLQDKLNTLDRDLARLKAGKRVI